MKIKKNKKSTNIQIGMLIDLMREADPDLFSNKSEPMPVTDKQYTIEDAWWDAIK